MSADAVIDTNIFIFQLDVGDSRKQVVAEHIVRQALAAGCRRLLSDDLQHGQRVERLAIIDPFKA